MKEVQTVAIAERKFSDFFDITDRFEASDVIYKDGYFYVVFDNLYQIAKIRADLDPKKTGNRLLGKTADGHSGYEGITFDENQSTSMPSLSAPNIPIPGTEAKCMNTIPTLSVGPVSGGSTLTLKRIPIKDSRACHG
jgi:hypothetical protein